MGQASVEPTVEKCDYCLKHDGHLEGCPTNLPEDPTARSEFCKGSSDGFDNIPSESNHPSYQLGYEQGKAARLRWDLDPLEDMI